MESDEWQVSLINYFMPSIYIASASKCKKILPNKPCISLVGLRRREAFVVIVWWYCIIVTVGRYCIIITVGWYCIILTIWWYSVSWPLRLFNPLGRESLQILKKSEPQCALQNTGFEDLTCSCIDDVKKRQYCINVGLSEMPYFFLPVFNIFFMWLLQSWNVIFAAGNIIYC